MGTWPPSTDPKMNKEAAYIPVRTPPKHICPPPVKTYFPWIVPLIFLVDVAAFAYTMYINDCPSHSEDCWFPDLGRFSFEPLKINPFLGPAGETLLPMGALNLDLVLEKGETWRLFTCMWLHAGVVHLLANMISLLFVGIRLENEFGFWRIGLLYIFSGIGGSLASCYNFKYPIDDKGITTSVGASGALFGLLGAMLSELIMNWTIYANKCAALLTLILVICFNMAIGFIPHIRVDISSHIGGFLAGYFLGFILLIRPQFGWVNRKYVPPGYEVRRIKPKYKCYQYCLWIVALIILILGYACLWLLIRYGPDPKQMKRVGSL